ncbi:MAG TPA: AgmX/PglI C-terminal domain-containing protein, partial [Anaeromyxobacteraceae bacterium]
ARTSSRSRRREAAEPPPRPARRPTSRRTAAAEPPPAPTPAEQPAPRRKPAGDPLLDVGGDDELEKELGAGRNAKRSVYVPPAIGSDLPDSVSQSQIQEAVAGQKNALFRCIEQQRSADPDAHGTLRMRWVIAGDGSVREVRALSDEFARQPVAPCITGVVKGIRFPRSRTSGQEVVFPFKF